jgi:outer membrane protein OmpA-like peptidoglycan-associated protein
MTLMFVHVMRALAMAALLLAGQAGSASAADVESIVKALTPRPKAPATRSFSGSGSGPGRGIAIEGGETQPEAAPSIDLHVPFEYDKSDLTMSDAQLVVDTLGKALKDPRLANLKFQIIGHTDARGGAAHNEDLSKRRAETVRARLTTFHGIEAARLQTSGRGSRELKDPAQPDHGINRRVQIKTMDEKTS